MNRQKTIYLTGLFIITFLCFVNCNNDNESPPMPISTPVLTSSPNQNICNYQGATFIDTNNNTTTLIPESDLFTDFFNTSSNGPEVEIYRANNLGNFKFFTTAVVTLNGTGTGTLNYNGNTFAVNVICKKTGNAIGDEMRFDLTASGIQVEFCVIIDDFH